MSIIFCRHAQTVFNELDIFQGLSDSPLTVKGRENALKLNLFLKQNFNINKFFVSDLGRVIETYKIVSNNIDADLCIDKRLREVCFGEWEEKRRSDIDKKILKIRSSCRYDFIYPGFYKDKKGESFSLIYERVVSFIKDVESFGFLNNNVDCCCITHQGVLINVIRYFLKYSRDKLNSLKIDNNILIIVNSTNNKEINLEFIDFLNFNKLEL